MTIGCIGVDTAEMEKLHTVSQAATQLGLTPVRVRQFCQQGRLGQKIGWLWLISDAELRRFAGKPRNPGKPKKKKTRFAASVAARNVND